MDLITAKTTGQLNYFGLKLFWQEKDEFN